MKVDKPQLRFSTFDEYWVGAKLSKLGSFLGGGTPDTNNAAYWTGHIGWLSSADVTDNVLFVKPKKYITESAIKASATKLVPQNSLLFVSRVGVGKLAINSSPVCTSQDFTNFTPTSVEVSFLGYYFQANKNLLKRYSQGTTIKGLTKDVIESIYVSFPESNNEQQKIADFLSSVDTKISQLTEKYRLLKEYKKGVMQQIFSQQIRFTDDDGAAFPKWTGNRLDYFIERVSDPVDLATGVEYREIGIRSHGKGIFHKNPVTSSDIDNKRVFWVKEKALVLNIVFAWERAVAVTSDGENGFIASHRFPMYLPKENRADVNYLLYFLLSPKGTRLLNIASPGGAGRNKTLGQSEFAKLKVCLPSIKEQQKITQFLQAIDIKIEGVADQIEQTKQFKKGLLQQMFV
ncbi:restriction endonuclease subunit S [Vibrio vulnificus]|nr:restriction endonuclease subunit S [Vibrio vulnificus]EHU4914997.1 restriction endonuclease subunit S [Vibrio vulnificus]EIV8481554.1 restriction endonuclease subunit S [Vibrio vulnificus]EIZ1049403.1 restriction endonuclease subunit S [Vibrio vulnificus]MCU8307536.1 restriction endonuclease subunit S [Vibrio vulnificus]